MFIAEYPNTKPYPCQYGNVFDNEKAFPYIQQMAEMREILKLLMAKAGDDAYSLESKSHVPQPTTQRFLSGKHGDPRSGTVRKWAKAYGVTESQLRGYEPLSDNKRCHLIKDITDALLSMDETDFNYVCGLCNRLRSNGRLGESSHSDRSIESVPEPEKKEWVKKEGQQ